MGLGINIPDPLERFRIFLPGQAHTLPSFYWNVYNDEQRVKYLCCLVDALLKQQDMYVTNNNEFNKALKELSDAFDKFVDSGFDDYYRQQIEEWIGNNLDSLFASYSRGVYFGLTLDGHFVAYVPESWNDIVFDTGADYTLDTYGRLILRMDVDSPYDADQRPEVVRPYDDSVLEEKVRNIMNTLYAAGGV